MQQYRKLQHGGGMPPREDAMEGVLLKRTLKALGVAAALAVLAALLSFAPNDPTLTNLRYPARGIANWLGYPGALLGGSLVELFGTASLLLPLLMLNRALNPRRPAALAYLAYGLCTVLLLAAALGLRFDPAEVPALGLGWQASSPLQAEFWRQNFLQPGLLGWAAGHWLLGTTGLRWSLGLLAGALVYGLLRLADAPRFTDLLAAGWLALKHGQWRAVLRESLRQAGHRAVRGAIYGATHGITHGATRAGTMGAASVETLVAGSGALAAAAGAGIVAGAINLARGIAGALPNGLSAARARATGAPGGEREPSAAHREVPAPDPRDVGRAHGALAADRIARWEELLQRYAAKPGAEIAAGTEAERAHPGDPPWSLASSAQEDRSARRKP